MNSSVGALRALRDKMARFYIAPKCLLGNFTLGDLHSSNSPITTLKLLFIAATNFSNFSENLSNC